MSLERLFTVGQVSLVAKANRGTVLRVIDELGIVPERTEGGQRRLRQSEAQSVIDAICDRREGPEKFLQVRGA